MANTKVLIENTIDPAYAEALRKGLLAGEGILHELHSCVCVPDTVFFRGIEYPLLTLDFIECELEGLGWVTLSEELTVTEPETHRILDGTPLTFCSAAIPNAQ